MPSVPRHEAVPSRVFAIDTARALAVLALVSYHKIGDSHTGGLRIAYPDPLRIFADALIDVRMPLFAAIAGLVYAMRPPGQSGLGRFLIGKMRRLAVPGVVATAIFAASANHLGTGFAVDGPVWWPFVSGYAHFWFLQAMLVIFVVWAPLDALTEGRALPWAFGGSMGFLVSGATIPTEVMSLARVIDLLPYFLAGVGLWRWRAAIHAHRRAVAVAAAAALMAGMTWNFAGLARHGTLSLDRHDLQSLITAMGHASSA